MHQSVNGSYQGWEMSRFDRECPGFGVVFPVPLPGHRENRELRKFFIIQNSKSVYDFFSQ